MKDWQSRGRYDSGGRETSNFCELPEVAESLQEYAKYAKVMGSNRADSDSAASDVASGRNIFSDRSI
jgi:hypothetical protein